MKGSLTPCVASVRGGFACRVGLWSSGGPRRDGGAMFSLVFFDFT